MSTVSQRTDANQPTNNGKPPGRARMALLAVLQQGYSGTFDALARYTGLPCHTVRQTLSNMRRAGVVQAQRDATCHQPQRARAIYCLAHAKESFDALRYAAQVWR